MIDGLKERVTSGGIPVLTLHYSADPDKRAGTDRGDLWLAHAVQGYPGGVRSPRWRKEMEIDYRAMGGHKFIEDWDLLKKKVVVPVFEPQGYRLYGVYDHGWRNAACYMVHGINYDGHPVTLWEFYGTRVPVPYIKRIINGLAVTLPDGRKFHGNPYAGRESMRIADPQIWEEDQVMKDNTMKSVARLFEVADADCPGVFFSTGNHGGDTTVAEWLIGHYWADPENPTYHITTDCPKLIWELGRLRHQEISPKVAEHRDLPEKMMEKDNHAWDCVKMFFLKFPPKVQRPKPQEKPNTFAWWRDQAKRASEGREVQSYQRMTGE